MEMAKSRIIGKKSMRERLHRLRAAVEHASPEREGDARRAPARGDVEAVKNGPREHGVKLERHHREAEQIGDVSHLVVRRGFEVNPAEDERKGDRRREQATPEEELVHPPAQVRARDK